MKLRITLCCAVLAAAGCEHKKKTEETKPPDDQGGMTPKPTPGSDMAGRGTDAAGSGGGSAGSAGSGAPTEPTQPSASDTVRETTAADLADYVKGVPGDGDKLLAEIQTSEGDLHCVLFADKAPLTVAS